MESTKSNMANILPAPGRKILIEASSIDPGVKESVKRDIAINNAISAVKLMYPNFFNKEQ